MYEALTRSSTLASRSFTRLKSECCGEPARSSMPRSSHVATSATGRSRLMCAFMPARANWSGAIPLRERAANSGAQADGVEAGLPSRVSTASKNRFAKTMSSRSRKAESANVLRASSALTPFVTSQYRRAKHTTPSERGEAPWIASSRAITPATVVGWAVVTERRYTGCPHVPYDVSPLTV